MIILINKELVLSEIMILGKLKISEKLNVPVEQIGAEITIEGNKVIPDFRLPVEIRDRLGEDSIEECIKHIWMEILKPELINRLKGLDEVRSGKETKIKRENKT